MKEIRTKEIDGLLRTAIHQKHLIKFRYQGKIRIAEPHDYGIQNGKLRLFCYQTGGQSGSGTLPDWRLFEIVEISGLEILSETFPGRREIASGKHHVWDEILARVK
jgi:hypothetical protein